MILHPGVLALFTCSLLTLFLLLVGGSAGITILRYWDYNSSSAPQLQLERRTYLVSTLVNYGFGFQLLSLVLFIYTMDDVHRLFVGAMCATGSLNANQVGWAALFSKLGLFFLSGFWIALNVVDQRGEDYPLVKIKYLLLILLLPLVCLDIFLLLSYFLGLEPDIITSCCGSLFGSDATVSTSSISSFPVLPSMVIFYIFSGCLAALFVWNLVAPTAFSRVLYSLNSATFLIVSIISIVSFVSIYIYELPTHHCPFDILQKGYNYIGYPLYLFLFTGSFLGMLPGLFQSLAKISSLSHVVPLFQRKWLIWSIVNLTVFTVMVSYAVYSSNLTTF